MGYLAMLLRIGIIIIGFKMMSLSGWTLDTPPFYSGIAFILIGIYFALIAMVGPKKILCPIWNSVGDNCKK